LAASHRTPRCRNKRRHPPQPETPWSDTAPISPNRLKIVPIRPSQQTQAPQSAAVTPGRQSRSALSFTRRTRTTRRESASSVRRSGAPRRYGRHWGRSDEPHQRVTEQFDRARRGSIVTPIFGEQAAALTVAVSTVSLLCRQDNAADERRLLPCLRPRHAGEWLQMTAYTASVPASSRRTDPWWRGSRSGLAPLTNPADRVESSANENRASCPADRKCPSDALRGKRTGRFVSDRGVGQAGTPGHDVRERRFVDLGRARPLHQRRLAADADRAGSDPLLHAHARQGARSRR